MRITMSENHADATTFLSPRTNVLWSVVVASWIAVWTPRSMADEPAAAPAEDALPTLEQVTATIGQHFRELKDYEPGDLISRTEVRKALDRVANLGWEVPHRAALEKLVLPESAFLVTQLQSKSGTRFMRKIARYPHAYDRLDRLSSLSGGRRIITRLVRDKGGYELIEYLSTSQGGANLGRMLAGAQGGSDLNKPTGRIYTVDALVKAVQKIYRAQGRAMGE